MASSTKRPARPRRGNNTDPEERAAGQLLLIGLGLILAGILLFIIGLGPWVLYGGLIVSALTALDSRARRYLRKSLVGEPESLRGPAEEVPDIPGLQAPAHLITPKPTQTSRLELFVALLLVVALVLDILGMIAISLGLGPWLFYVGLAITSVFALPIVFFGVPWYWH